MKVHLCISGLLVVNPKFTNLKLRATPRSSVVYFSLYMTINASHRLSITGGSAVM